jgi:hypothetical protein
LFICSLQEVFVHHETVLMSPIIGAVRYVNKFHRLTSINDSNKFVNYLTWHTLLDTVEFSLKCLNIDITIHTLEEFRMACNPCYEHFLRKPVEVSQLAV